MTAVERPSIELVIMRISKVKRHFAKGYMANWTEELFTIVDALRSDPPVYRLVDWHGDRLDGTFYEHELQKVIVPAGKKTLMWRYFTKKLTLRYVDVLQDFVRSYNNTYHRSIGMAPSAVNGANQEMVWQRMYDHDGGGTPKYRVGDHVRISKVKRHFAKGYMANWTEELFTIADAHRSDPPVYRLVDWHGDRLDGTFYEPELQKVIVP